MSNILCLNCGKNESQIVQPYGVLPCRECTELQKKYKAPVTIEVTTNHIREERKEYSRDILQRYRGNTPSLEYIKQYGTNGFTKEEIKQARNVWTEDQPYVDKHEKITDTKFK